MINVFSYFRNYHYYASYLIRNPEKIQFRVVGLGEVTG